MKKAMFRIGLMLALAFLAAAQFVRAQEPVVANIPFAFVAGNTPLPAGEYRVQKVSDGSPALLIRCTAGGPAIMVVTRPASVNAPQQKSKLIFRRHANRYFLGQVWSAGSASGRELPKSAKEKEQLLARNEAPDQVTIVAHLITPNR